MCVSITKVIQYKLQLTNTIFLPFKHRYQNTPSPDKGVVKKHSLLVGSITNHVQKALENFKAL